MAHAISYNTKFFYVFLFVSILELIEIRLDLKGEYWRLFSGFYTGCISFMSLNQQCVSTKGTMLDASAPFYT